jgi:hypothetical protein
MFEQQEHLKKHFDNFKKKSFELGLIPKQIK